MNIGFTRPPGTGHEPNPNPLKSSSSKTPLTQVFEKAASSLNESTQSTNSTLSVAANQVRTGQTDRNEEAICPALPDGVEVLHSSLDAATKIKQMLTVTEEAKQAYRNNDASEKSVDDLIDRMLPSVKINPFSVTLEEESLNKVISAHPDYAKYKDISGLEEALVNAFKWLCVKKIQFLLNASDANIPEAYAYYSTIIGLLQFLCFGGTNWLPGDAAWEHIGISRQLRTDMNKWETGTLVDEDGTSFTLVDEDGTSFVDTTENRNYLKNIYQNNMPLADTAQGSLALGKLHYHMTKHRGTPCANHVLKNLQAESPQQIGFTFSQARNYLEACLQDGTLPLGDRAQAALYFSKIVHNPSLAYPDPDPTKAEQQRRIGKRMLKYYLDQAEVPALIRAQLAYQLGVYYWNNPKKYKQKAFNAFLKIYQLENIDNGIRRAAALQMLRLCYHKYVNVPAGIDYYQILSQEYARRKETLQTPVYSIQYHENTPNPYFLINENDTIITFLMMEYYIHHRDQKPAHVDIEKEINRCVRMTGNGKERSRFYELLGDHLHLNDAQMAQAIYYYDLAVSLITRGPFTKEYTEDAVCASKILQKIVEAYRGAQATEKAEAYMNRYVSSFTGDPLEQVTMFVEILKNPCYRGLQAVKYAAAKIAEFYQKDPTLCSADDHQLALQQIEADISLAPLK